MTSGILNEEHKRCILWSSSKTSQQVQGLNTSILLRAHSMREFHERALHESQVLTQSKPAHLSKTQVQWQRTYQKWVTKNTRKTTGTELYVPTKLRQYCSIDQQQRAKRRMHYRHRERMSRGTTYSRDLGKLWETEQHRVSKSVQCAEIHRLVQISIK